MRIKLLYWQKGDNTSSSWDDNVDSNVKSKEIVITPKSMSQRTFKGQFDLLTSVEYYATDRYIVPIVGICDINDHEFTHARCVRGYWCMLFKLSRRFGGCAKNLRRLIERQEFVIMMILKAAETMSRDKLDGVKWRTWLYRRVCLNRLQLVVYMKTSLVVWQM